MSPEEKLSKQLEAAIDKLLKEDQQAPSSALAESSAKAELRKEEDFYQLDLHVEKIADMQSARTQREKYARWVFSLVAGWIGALFLILIAQGACPAWHAFSDKVLITLISSMTINLIGTLVIVLKYIFRSDQNP